MFCPNCGKNCGDAKFCVSCGAKVQQTENGYSPSIGWKIGMPCPHCGGTKLEGKNCAFCGGQLLYENGSNLGHLSDEDSFEIPYRHYRGFAVTLHVTKDSLIIEEDQLFGRKKRTQVPYHQLTAVEFVRTEDAYGSIRFLWRGGRDNVESFFFRGGAKIKCTEFFHVFQSLRAIVSSTVEFSTQLPECDTTILKEYGLRIDLDSYFVKYNPYRNRAVDAIKTEHALPENDAQALIDALFNMRQRELYEADPRLAIRDINRYWEERTRLYEEDRQERAERRATRQRIR